MEQQLNKGTLLHGGAYKIEEVLGQGSFGITYLALHMALNKKVAIKEFFMRELNGRGEDGSIMGMSDGSLSMNYAQKFKKEALNLAGLEHPNIVRITDSFEDNGTFYYVMDYIEGENLNDYIKHNYVSRQEAVDIIRDVAKALMYMHEEKHMLHLDLKPGNIMRRASDGHIFLIDFGLSKHYSDDGQPETSTTIGLGTAGYAPIEQANQAKNGEFRPTIDVYALGATFYKLLTRETPPAASELVSDDELLAKNLKQHNVSGKLSNVVVNAMLPNVRKRTQTVNLFLSSLDTKRKASKVSDEYTIADVVETLKEAKSTTDNTLLFRHPDFFDETTYVIDSKYSNNPTSTVYKAQQGNLDCMIAYGMMCLRGKGHPQNITMAYDWFKKAMEAGDGRGANMVQNWDTIKEKYDHKKEILSEISANVNEQTNGDNDEFLDELDEDKYFYFRGRIGRLEYFLSSMGFSFALITIICVCSTLFNEPLSSRVINGVSIIYCWAMLAQGAKRCHDLGNSGWFQLIPFYVLAMLFIKGDTEDNEYGEALSGGHVGNRRILVVEFIVGLLALGWAVGANHNSGEINDTAPYNYDYTDSIAVDTAAADTAIYSY